jgi:hypothetical protein
MPSSGLSVKGQRYHPLKPREGGLMKDYAPHPIELDPSMLEYLEDIAKRFSLSDVGKAVRCLINYSRENPDRSKEIFDEVRCTGC